MNILNGIKNFLQFINDNWTMITIIIALILSIVNKIINFFKKSDSEKIEIAKKQIKETILEMVTMAEFDYEELVKAGNIKRSKVFEKIFEKYPILSTVVDQDELIEWIDCEIINALNILKGIIKENKEVS